MSKRKQYFNLFKTYTDVFYWNLYSKAFVNINQGGTSSSKTVSIVQLIIKLACEKPNRKITIVGQDMPNLRVGAMKIFQDLIFESDIAQYFVRNPYGKAGIYEFHNRSVVEFKAFDSAQDAKSGKREILFVNEADGVDYDIYFELAQRTTERIFIDFNPNVKFWAHDLIGDDDTVLFISNYKNNPWIPKQTLTKILSYYKKWQESIIRDRKGNVVKEDTFWKNKWRVYGLGKTGVVEGAIFEIVHYTHELPDGLLKKGYGLDFGFETDPTALIIAGLHPNNPRKLMAKELIYEKHLDTWELVAEFKRLGVAKRDRAKIIADRSDPAQIALLQRFGYNVEKGKSFSGAIEAGIKVIKNYDLYLTHDSTNWKIEQEKYTYKKRRGEWINEPIDKYNHCWDALRYYALHHLAYDGKELRKQGKRKVSIR